MNNIEVDELIKVLESIRKDKYNSIPSELIQSIVNTQFENQDDRAQARQQTKKFIDDFLRGNFTS